MPNAPKQVNAASQEEINAARENARRIRECELEDVRWLLSHPQGVRFFRRLLEKGGVFRTTFTGDEKTFFLEGNRNLALVFFNDCCEAAPDAVRQLVTKSETP